MNTIKIPVGQLIFPEGAVFDSVEVRPLLWSSSGLLKKELVLCEADKAEIWGLEVTKSGGEESLSEDPFSGYIGLFDTMEEADRMLLFVSRIIDAFSGRREPRVVPGIIVPKDVLSVVDFDVSLIKTSSIKAFFDFYAAHSKEIIKYTDSSDYPEAEHLISVDSCVEIYNLLKLDNQDLFRVLMNFRAICAVNDASYIRFTIG